MQVEGVSPINNGYDPSVPVPSKSPDSSKIARGDRAVTKMLKRTGMMDRVDRFFGQEAQNELDSYFLDKTRAKKLSLSDPLTEDGYENLAHELFAIFRRELVEKAYQQASDNPNDWTFAEKNELEKYRETFQDFMWIYSKMLFSVTPSDAILKAMQQEFPSLPTSFRPGLHIIRLPPDQEDFFPNS